MPADRPPTLVATASIHPGEDTEHLIVRTHHDLSWGPEEWARARREPWHAAAQLAQRQTRFDHPRLTMPFPRSHEGGDELVGHALQHAGYGGDTEGAFVARHPRPEDMTSNPSWLNGKPGVALHPDRWDYGTVCHECAHHAVKYANAEAINEYPGDEGSHGPQWAGHYAKGLDWVSPGAGDDFLAHHQRYHQMIHDQLQVMRPSDLDAADRQHTAKAWLPGQGIFGPTTGLDARLFDGDQLRPEVRRDLMERLDRALRVDTQLTGSEWQEYLRVYLAGGSASEWAGGRPNETAQDLDVLLGVDYDGARHHGAFPGLDDSQIDAALNAALRSQFNAPGWQPGFGGKWDLTGFVNHAAYDIRDIKPYAAYDVSDMQWAVKPPHLPGHSAQDFHPAILAEARAVAAQARAILRLPEPMRTREAKSLWEKIHADRSRAFSIEGEGWEDASNLIEKYLAYHPWRPLEKIRALVFPQQKTAAGMPTFYHGTRAPLEEGQLLTPGSHPTGYDSKPLPYMFFTTDRAEADRWARSSRHSGGGPPRVYEVEPTGEHHRDPGAKASFETEHPLRVVRRVPWGVGMKMHQDDIRNAGTSRETEVPAVEQRFRDQPKTAAAGPPLENPYHGGSTWYHGTRRALDDLGAGRQIRDEDRATNYSGGEQFNKLLGTHFDPLHSVAHHFTSSGQPSAIHHAELRFRNPAHFDSEDHLLTSAFRWASQHHPAFHDDIPNGEANSAYDKERGPEKMSDHLIRADQQMAPDDPDRRYRLKPMIESFFQWHPKSFEMAQGYARHLESQGHHGITYGNNVEGPRDHVSAIATDPSQIHVTHTERLHPLGEPIRGEDGRAQWDEQARDFKRHPVQVPPGHTTYPESAKHNESPEFLVDVAHRHHPGTARIDDQGFFQSYPSGPPKRLPGWNYQAAKEASAGPQLTVKDYEGTVGRSDHITRGETGLLPLDSVRGLEGVKGEKPGESPWHRTGQEWEDFKGAVARGEGGAGAPIFITVDHGQEPKISEGNQRRDAYAELGHSHVPVEIRYYGHAEQQGSVHERAMRKQASGGSGDRFVTCGQGHEHWGAHGAAGLLIRHRDGDSGAYHYLLQKRSENVDHGGTWSTPGGAIGKDETPEQGAQREAREEWGSLPHGLTHHHTYTDDHGAAKNVSSRCPRHGAPENREDGAACECPSSGKGWAYHTVVMDAPERFAPGGKGETGWESDGHAWVTPQEAKDLPLHPGFAASFDKVRRSGAKTAAATVMYHGTSPAHRNSIGQHGLSLLHSQDEGDWKSIYMTERPGDDPHEDVWRVDVSGYHPEVDGDSGEDRSVRGESYFVNHDIPPGRLRLHRPGTGNKWIGYPPKTAAATGPASDLEAELQLPSRLGGFERNPGAYAPDPHPSSGKDRVYLRFGDWHPNERSVNHAQGWEEDGVSAYHLDKEGHPVDPDPKLERDPEEYGNDTAEEMGWRVQRAERVRARGEHSHTDVAHLVKGEHAGIGYDGEPLLQNVRRVGDWMDHRHLFIPGAPRHRLARDEGDEDYEPPEEQPLHHEGALKPRATMISLDIPQGLIHKVDNGVDEHPHITVVYAGHGVSEDKLKEVIERAREAAANTPALSGHLEGLGTFEPSESSDGKVPAYVPVHVPGLDLLHEQLADLSASEHPFYQPHVTLKYCEPGEELPPPHPKVPVTFTHLSVHCGGSEVARIPLGSGVEKTSVLGPSLYHGTLHEYEDGQVIDPAQPHEKSMPEGVPGRFYFTTNQATAGGIARYQNVVRSGKPDPGHVYQVEPTGSYKRDRTMSGEPGDHYWTDQPVRVVRRMR